MIGPDATANDLCAREPIHQPGFIQPHGALLVLDRNSLEIVQASANATAFFGYELGRGKQADVFFSENIPLSSRLRDWLAGGELFYRDLVFLADHRFHVSGHATAQGILLEFEVALAEPPRSGGLHHRLHRLLDVIEPLDNITHIAEAAAAEVATLCGFDRVMTYRFAEDGSGVVLAEVSADGERRYFDLRFPASDIPAQARRLYVANRLRLITDVDYRPVPLDPPLSPLDGRELDMSLGALRSVSPVHLEYLRNMGVRASMSVSLVIDGELWGLIACHHDEPRMISPRVRAACEMTGRVVAQRIGVRLRMAEAAERLALSRTGTRLLTYLARSETLDGALGHSPEAWLHIAGAGGCAVLLQGAVQSWGETPPREEVAILGQWLRARPVDTVYETDCLSAAFPSAAAYSGHASGLLAISISQLHASYIMWFRPEVERTLRWAGEPSKSVEGGGEIPPTLHPRHSFAEWRQKVAQRSAPWRTAEIESAREFRHAVIGLVLRQAETRAGMAAALERTNAELESFSYSVSHDLRAPFRHIIGFAELLGQREGKLDATSRRYLDTITDSALAAGHLVDDLLSFSRLGRAQLAVSPIDMGKLVREVLRSLEGALKGRDINMEIGDLPPTFGDAALLRQALLNLIDNAVKYSHGRSPAHILIDGKTVEGRAIYRVVDNGAGFDMSYAGKLFGVFQRLHGAEQFEGTGIGLALTKRIIERHGGKISAAARPDEGATFTFELPAGALGNAA
jgi:two-component system, chemotaxis family, sensor kinase Cph1